MQGKHWLVIVSILVVSEFGCRELNREYYCPDHPDDPDCAREPDKCGDVMCMAPTPVCKTETNTCVECLVNTDCPAAVPICSDQHTCVQCQLDDDCDSKLCLDGGQCADPVDVTYVGGSNATDNATCSIDVPCKTLTQGLQALGVRRYIKITGAVSDTAATTIHDKKVTIYGRSAAQISRTFAGEVLIVNGFMDPVANLYDLEIICNIGAGGKHCVEVSDMATATLTRVNVHYHGQAGIAMDGVKLVLNDSEVHDNSLEGLLITRGTVELYRASIYKNGGVAGVSSTNAVMVTIDSSIITGNTGSSGGISITGGAAIRNSMIVKNANTSSLSGGLFLNSTAGLVEFSTIANNVSDMAGNAGIACIGTVYVQNSILTGNNSTVPISASCNVMYSLTGTSPPVLPGVGNAFGDPVFLNVADPSVPGFFRIGASSAARNKADPASPVAVDIDGQARDDGMKDMGADEYK